MFGSILALAGLIITFLLPSKTFSSTNKSETAQHKHSSGNSHLVSYENEELMETGESLSPNDAVTACKNIIHEFILFY